MVRPNKYHIFVAGTCVYAVFLFYLSSLSSPPGLSDLGFLAGLVHIFEDRGLAIPIYLAYRYRDKFAHVMLYLGFGLLLNRTVSSSQNGIVSKYAAPFSLIIGLLYAITDEVHQTFVLYRTASSLDLVADFFGLLFAQLLILMYFSIKRFLKQDEVLIKFSLGKKI